MDEEINYEFVKTPEKSEWKCYLFGSRPSSPYFAYIPQKGHEPNWFVRWMMRVCFDCLWVKEKK